MAVLRSAERAASSVFFSVSWAVTVSEARADSLCVASNAEIFSQIEVNC